MQRALLLDLAGYALAIVSVSLVGAFRHLVGPSLDAGYLALLFFAPVLLTIWFGNLRSSFFCVTLAALALLYFNAVSYPSPDDRNQWLPVLVFVAQGAFLSWLVHALRSRGQRSLELANSFLESMTKQNTRKDEDETWTRLVEHLPDIIFRLDKNLKFDYVSPILGKHFDVATESLLNTPVDATDLPGDMKRAISSAGSQARDSGETVYLEFSAVSPLGRREYRGRLIPEISERGWPTSVLGVLTDVTRRKRFEQELQRFRTMSARSTDLCFCAGVHDSKLSYANQQVVDELGYTEDEIYQLTLAEVQSDFSLERFQGWARQLGANGKLAPVECYFFRRNGDPIPVELSLSLLEIDGQPHVCGVARNLSEQRRAEDALRLFNERLELVVQNIDIGFFYCDLPFSNLIWNQQCKRHFGLPEDAEVTIDTFYERLHPDDHEPTRRAIEHAIEAGTVYDIAYRTIAPDKTQRWIRAIGRAFYDADSKPVRFDGVTLDITAQKRTEEALKDADRRKNQFLAMLSHELRNPLAAIRNAMHLFTAIELQDPGQIEARDILQRQFKLLASLVDDLLDIFRITHKKIPLRNHPVELKELLASALADMQGTMRQARLKAQSILPDHPVWVAGDRVRLLQIINNLLHNSVKFTPAEGQIDISLKDDPDTGFVTMTVRDTGVGIAPEMLHRVFETFAQADQDLARSSGGLGLGLAMVQGLVELHGGSITVHSAGKDQGAEFVVQLPLIEAPKSDPLPQSETPSSRSLRLLIIEDNFDTARSLALLLRRYGHRVEVAHGGAEGVGKATTLKPNVILCDIGLPEMDGYEVARTLRADPITARTHLIAVSGYGQDEERRRSREAGFDLHLTKPVDPSDLQRLLSVLTVKT